MRKQQITLLEKAAKKGFTASQIALLSREDLTIAELRAAMNFFDEMRSKTTDGDLLAAQAERYLAFLSAHKHEVANADNYAQLLYIWFYIPLSERQKMHVWKMYLFLWKCARKNNECYVDGRLLESYTFMLSQPDFTVWHRTVLLRAMICDKTKRHRLGHYFNAHPGYACLLDDFVHNRKNSLLYFLVVETNIISAFYPSNDVLEKFYDKANHCFLFRKDEFDKYFTRQGYIYAENSDYITYKILEQYPLISLIADFCTNSEMVPGHDCDDSYMVWRTWQLMDPSKAEHFAKCHKLLGQGFTTAADAFYFSVHISASCFVEVIYKTYKSIYVGADNSNGWCTTGRSTEISFLISPDGKLFSTSRKTKKHFPLAMHTFAHWLATENRPEPSSGNIFGVFLKLLFDFHQKKNPFYRDVVSDCLHSNRIIPLSFNEVANYYNRADLLIKKYKAAASLHINWNKLNLNFSYLIIKSYSLVAPGISQRILLQQRDSSLCFEFGYGRTSKENVDHFLTLVLRNLIKSQTYLRNFQKVAEIKDRYSRELMEELTTDVLPDEYDRWLSERVEDELPTEDLLITIHDYIRMCRQSKIKVRLDIRSTRQLSNLHDRITGAENYYRQYTQEVKVPKNSRFLHLREILPEEFEWIKTRKRLILETELQHHCVWSYADRITQDSCAIYSYVDSRAEHTSDGKPKRYTIEFVFRNGTYFVQQVQGKCNAANANGMKEYIQSLLVSYMQEGPQAKTG